MEGLFEDYKNRKQQLIEAFSNDMKYIVSNISEIASQIHQMRVRVNHQIEYEVKEKERLKQRREQCNMMAQNFYTFGKLDLQIQSQQM